MKKISVNMIVQENMPEGQGVGSAYLEQAKLVSEGAKDLFDVTINNSKDADINHYHTINPNHYYRLATSKGANVTYVHFLPHTLDGSVKIPKPMFDIFKKYVIRFYKDSDYLVVVNPIFKKELEQYDIKSEIVYIPNYVSKEDFYPKENTKDKIKEEYNIDKDKFVVIGVGQVQTRKGVLDFVEIAKKLPNVEFVWCGGFSFGAITDGYNELKEVMENPPKNVKFVGIIPREKMNDMYNMADILFMPSYNELFPMAILEAVNTHIPLLLRDLELYEDILFKKYVTAKNNKDFAKEIEKLSTNKKYYQKYSENSKYISEFYSKENVLKLWIEFYTRVHKEHVEKKLNKKIKRQERLDKIDLFKYSEVDMLKKEQKIQVESLKLKQKIELDLLKNEHKNQVNELKMIDKSKKGDK